jgi:hypothetical protein
VPGLALKEYQGAAVEITEIEDNIRKTLRIIKITIRSSAAMFFVSALFLFLVDYYISVRPNHLYHQAPVILTLLFVALSILTILLPEILFLLFISHPYQIFFVSKRPAEPKLRDNSSTLIVLIVLAFYFCIVGQEPAILGYVLGFMSGFTPWTCFLFGLTFAFYIFHFSTIGYFLNRVEKKISVQLREPVGQTA